MGVKTLLEQLTKHLDKGKKKEATIRCEQVDLILGKLGKKERKLRKALAGEKDKLKRKKLNMEVRIISLQRKKGIKRRKELKDRCK